MVIDLSFSIKEKIKMRPNVYSTTFKRILILLLIYVEYILFTSFTVAAHKLINASCCVDKLALACIERV